MNQTATPVVEETKTEDENKSRTNKSTTSVKYTPFPPDDRLNPYADEEIKPH